MSVAAGDIVALRVPEGWLYGWVLAVPGGYPPAVGFVGQVFDAPVADPVRLFDDAGLHIGLVPVWSALAAGQGQVAGHRANPPAPRFRVPILNRAGIEVYDWVWQDGRLSLRAPGDDAVLPLRTIVPLADIARRLTAR
jgi:hypothetical protein